MGFARAAMGSSRGSGSGQGLWVGVANKVTICSMGRCTGRSRVRDREAGTRAKCKLLQGMRKKYIGIIEYEKEKLYTATLSYANVQICDLPVR